MNMTATIRSTLVVVGLTFLTKTSGFAISSGFMKNHASKLFASRFSYFEGVGYSTVVAKPLGVVFGENPEPYFGLVVDDVSEGLNGGMAGLRLGDNLIAINGESVVGEGFDTVMSMLVDAEGELDLQLYRGPVSSLYTILDNMNDDEEEEDFRDDEVVIMDENYESPVRIEFEEEKPLTPGDVLNAFKNIGSKILESDEENDRKPKQAKKGGLFGGLFSGETVQLDGDEASGLK